MLLKDYKIKYADVIGNKKIKCANLERVVYLQENVNLLGNLSEDEYCVVVETYNKDDYDNQVVNIEMTDNANEIAMLKKKAVKLIKDMKDKV